MNLNTFYFTETYFTPKDIFKGEKLLNENRNDSVSYIAESFQIDYSSLETFFQCADIVNLTDEKNTKNLITKNYRFHSFEDTFDTILLDKNFLENMDDFKSSFVNKLFPTALPIALANSFFLSFF